MYPNLNKDELTGLGKKIIDKIDQEHPHGMRYNMIKQNIIEQASKFFSLKTSEHPGLKYACKPEAYKKPVKKIIVDEKEEWVKQAMLLDKMLKKDVTISLDKSLVYSAAQSEF